MQGDSIFIKFAGIAGILTALTTVGVHYISFPADTFEARVLNSTNTLYIAHRWMIIFHCLFVIISMLGIALVKIKEARGFMILGFIFYVVFGVTEMARMFSVLQYLNPLRTQYLAAVDEGVRASLQLSIEQFNLVGTTLFALFAFAFAIGNLCYGIAFTGSRNSSRWIGYGFLYWALVSIAGMSNEFLQYDWINKAIEINAKTFQPLFRLLLGIWLLKNSINRS